MPEHWVPEVDLALARRLLLMSSLIAILYAASGLVSDYTNVTGGGSSTDGTAANLKDGNDATGAVSSWVGDGVSRDEGYHTEDWTMDALAAAPAGTAYVISKITVKLRGKKTQTVGTFTNNLRPRIASVDRGTAAAQTTSYGGNSYDFTTDPADSQPWTLAKINAQKFGFKTTCEAASVTINASSAYVGELSVEVWGDEVTTPPTVGAQATAPAAAMIYNSGSAGVLVAPGSAMGYAPDGAGATAEAQVATQVNLGVMEGSASPETVTSFAAASIDVPATSETHTDPFKTGAGTVKIGGAWLAALLPALAEVPGLRISHIKVRWTGVHKPPVV